MVQPIQSGFESLNRNIIEASFLSGKSSLVTLLRVAVPNIKPSILTAIYLFTILPIQLGGILGVVIKLGWEGNFFRKEGTERLAFLVGHYYWKVGLKVNWRLIR